MKKLICTLLAILLVSLSACSREPAQTTEPDPTQSTPTETTQATQPTQPQASDPVQNEETTTPTSPADEDYRLTSYAVVMGQYRQALQEKWSYERLMENDMSELLTEHYEGEPLDNVGYAFLDLNHDGIDELVLGACGDTAYPDNIIFDIYMLVDGTETHLLSSRARDRYYLTCLTDAGDDYALVRFGSSGASSTLYQGFTLSGDQLAAYQSVRYEGFDANPWMMGTQLDNGEIDYNMPIDESMGNALIEAAESSTITPDYTPLSQ